MEFFSGMLQSHVFYGALLMFILLYAFSYFTIFRSWKCKKRFEAASCFISLLHSTALVLLTSRDYFKTPWKLGAMNTPYQKNTLDFSTAYFTVDVLHFVLFERNDFVSVAHHIAASAYILTCRHCNHGAMSVMAVLFLAEVTSPMEFTWTLARMAKDDYPLARTLYIWLSPLFTVFFPLVRAGPFPHLLYKVESFYLAGGADGVIPRSFPWVWLGSIIITMLGSALWAYKLWRGLIKFYRKSAAGQPSKLK